MVKGAYRLQWMPAKLTEKTAAFLLLLSLYQSGPFSRER